MVKERHIVVTPADRAIRTAEINSKEREEALAQERANRNKDFVQFPRDGMGSFVGLIEKSPAAAQILLLMAAAMSRSNVVGVPSKPVCSALGISRATFSRAMALLKKELWIAPASEVGASAYKVNALGFWTTGRAFKGGSGVFRASLPVARNAEGRPLREVLKAVMVPVISSKTRKGTRRKGKSE